MIALGLRVVRGPDWSWGDQDGGEGFVGTVCERRSNASLNYPEKTVCVQWDNGLWTNYRIGYEEKYDLRVVDNAQIGVKHPEIICDGCKRQGVPGMVFKCLYCDDFDLCSFCYHADSHDLNHVFLRYDEPNSHGVEVPPRINARKVELKGIFVGAKVVRGPLWEWGNQDGGEGRHGRVMDIRGWDTESARSVANVTWSSGSTNVYRVGHKGHCDLKFAQPASAGMFYPDHLPVLGKRVSNNHLTTVPTFVIGDKVMVKDMTIEELKLKQQGHGGWNQRMAEYINKAGTVHRVTEKGDIRVQYEGCANRWTLNPAVLTKINGYVVGEYVYVISDLDKVKSLQKGHGDWTKVMECILGKHVQIVHLYSDGDLKIQYENKTWTLNPNCVQREPTSSKDDHSIKPSIERNSRSERLAADAASLLQDVSHGRLDAVRAKLKNHPEHVDLRSNGKTALQVAANLGHLQLVTFLLNAGASVNATDQDGDTALLFAAFGNHLNIVELLLNHGADPCAANKRRSTALHIAAVKQPPNCVPVLLANGANVNAQDFYGDTPLHDAISKENSRAVELLCDMPEIDVSLENKRGFNALHYAALKGNNFVTEILLKKYPSMVDVCKHDGFSALHLAALNGHAEVLETLIRVGKADIDLRNNKNQTALMLAVSQGHCGVIEMLVSLGANLNICDSEGDTALHLALLNRNKITQVRPDEAPLIHNIYLQLEHHVTDHCTALALACYLISVGCNYDTLNNALRSPLHLLPSDSLKDLLKSYSRNSLGNEITSTSSAESQMVRLNINEIGDDEGGESGDQVTSEPQQEQLEEQPQEQPQQQRGRPESKRATGASTKKPAECVVCSELSEENVTLEPCGHQPACEECSARMKKCIQCSQLIQKRVTKDGRTIPPKSRQPSLERIRYLEWKMAEIDEVHGCSICMERLKNVVFLCGHGACEKCANTLKTCHMCRKTIVKKILLY